ncbi:DEAD/DEAH box helicase family protein [Cetobacterium somerae]|uniref:DEAD/DEAH box helicase family protein n=1 Tax=Cetobacterium somerae TaxID=188913 RepID=UPI00225704AF|nr:DEAD/DEAH box helicase family protein [Cetobacterium somerae]MCX3068447.1 DEAD/DEAH box helicase family protein [Cetobacterium somerae]
MSFNDITLKYSYRSNIDNLVEDFLLKVLNESNEYLRATGYFSVELFNILEKKIYPFIRNNGIIKVICGIDLSKNDVDLINKGYDLRELIEKKIIQQEEYELSSLPNICWLIANKRLELKIALTDGYGIYHEKFSIFKDLENNYIATTGSLNETSSGYKKNIEYIDVFKSGRESERIEEKLNFFWDLWENKTLGIKVFEFNEKLIKKYEKFGIGEPIFYETETNQTVENLENKINLREYQILAIENLKNNYWTGIFAMATGTGKTITSLFALKEFLKTRKRGLIIIVCPYTHLVTQWEKEILKIFSNKKIIKCFENRNNWEEKLDLLIREILLNEEFGICITTISTGSKNHFLKKMNNTGVEKFIIIDEVHNIGSKESKKILEIKALFKLGLSATPMRKYDEEGNEAILKYFNKVVYEFSLKKAIEEGYLARYNYYLIFCELNDEEQEKYEELTKQIVNQINKKEKDEDLIQILLNKRSKIISSCQDKLNKLDYLLQNNKLKKSIFYTAEDKDFFEGTRKILNKNNVVTLNITAKESYIERGKIIEDLVEDKIDGILAMKCLDEGVDIPEVENAIILASSMNSKQYIQRRGRVLRKKNKIDNKIANIYDYIVIPREMKSETEKNIFARELKRVKEFLECAENKIEIILKLLKFSYTNTCMKEFIKLLEGEKDEE